MQLFANQYYKRLLVERPLPLHQISNMCLVDIILFFISIKMFFGKIPHLPICNYDTDHNLTTLYFRYLKQQTLKGQSSTTTMVPSTELSHTK